MSISIFDDKQIDLDLNGPILSFTTNPTGVGSTGVGINSTGGGTVSLTGIATATFPTSADNAGYVTYRWYEQGVGALSDSTYVAGTATTTLTLSNLITPTDDGRKFFVQADYVPPYTGTTATYTTGNATNEPINSGVGTVTVDPLLNINLQPTSRTTIPDRSVEFSVGADLTNDGTDLEYQWQLDGTDVTDGTVTKSTVTEVEGQGSIITQTTQTEATFTIPANVTDIIFDCAAGSGGNGGGNGGYDAGGTGGAGLAQRFTLSSSTSDRTVKFVVGKRGQDGQVGGHGHGHGASGASSGGTGAHGGSSGNGGAGGGGGGGSTGVYLDGVLVALLGGGGAGGGGGFQGTGYDGGSYDPAGGDPGLFPDTIGIGIANGGPGASSSTDSGGGGGGAGTGRLSPGYLSGGFAGAGGSGAGGGNKGDSEYRSDILGLENGTNNPDGNGWSSLIYTDPSGTTTTVETVTRTTTITGSATNNLTLSTDGAGIGYTVTAAVSSASASNSPLTTDIVNYQVLSELEEAVIVIEAIGVNNTATISTVDLNNDSDGDVEFSPATVVVGEDIFTQFFSFYAKDRDLDVEMDLYGGKGEDFVNTDPVHSYASASGGEGGFSRIRFTMKQNDEYVIAGLIDSVNAPFVYRKGALMACVGEGGSAGAASYGGAGGGVTISGNTSNGVHGNGGKGGNAPFAGSLTLNGIFGTAFSPLKPPSLLYPGDGWSGNANASVTNGHPGRTIRCTKGVYWAEQGIPPCTAMSPEMKFRLSDGTEVTNTANIVRGFKAGYNIMQTAGAQRNSISGKGGNGCTGGEGGMAAGGGGGSGYHDGSITVVSTQSGGSTEEAKVILRIVS